MKKQFVPMAVYYLSIQRLLGTILGRITAQTHSSLNNNKNSNHLMSFICIHREYMYYIPLKVRRPLHILYSILPRFFFDLTPQSEVETLIATRTG